jgi:hypothetical protein
MDGGNRAQRTPVTAEWAQTTGPPLELSPQVQACGVTVSPSHTSACESRLPDKSPLACDATHERRTCITLLSAHGLGRTVWGTRFEIRDPGLRDEARDFEAVSEQVRPTT